MNRESDNNQQMKPLFPPNGKGGFFAENKAGERRVCAKKKDNPFFSLALFLLRCYTVH